MSDGKTLLDLTSESITPAIRITFDYWANGPDHFDPKELWIKTKKIG
jgi:hypothetical protein